MTKATHPFHKASYKHKGRNQATHSRVETQYNMESIMHKGQSGERLINLTSQSHKSRIKTYIEVD